MVYVRHIYVFVVRSLTFRTQIELSALRCVGHSCSWSDERLVMGEVLKSCVRWCDVMTLGGFGGLLITIRHFAHASLLIRREENGEKFACHYRESLMVLLLLLLPLSAANVAAPLPPIPLILH